jgi:predicted nucleic acid-binding protein
MPAECFLDTNVLVYAAAGKRDEPRKFQIARALILAELFGTSGQVLAEFYVAATRRAKIPPAAEEIDEWIERVAAHPFVPVDDELVRAGIGLSRRYGIAYWDGAILAASERLGAPILYSEDLNHGQIYGSVRVINPFL